MAKGYGLTCDGLLLHKDGEVNWFNLQEIQAAINQLPEKSFHQKHCVEKCKNDCTNCRLMACPIADQ
ncbi:MAG: hypothetical protein GF365_03785 [Candidatus Buchananbacteria bacterium]|nr:hypothetical protein [Candidatus Buchananbacteria bacterium]